MKNSMLSVILLLGLLGCSGFQYNLSMPTAKGSVEPGEGNTVTFKGEPLALTGEGIRIGETLPAASVTANDLSEKNLADTRGTVRIISVVPSLDTPVCEQQTHAISEKNGGLDKDVQLITISMDLPFAQKRFSDKAKIKNILFLSDYRSADFGMNYGLLIKPLHLLSRAIIVVDRENIVRHLQVVPEITSLPDLEEALRVAKGLL